MRQSDGRIRTTHTGSLPRPPRLTELVLEARAQGAALAGERLWSGTAAA